jgi:AcrR family transcriptional regulator
VAASGTNLASIGYHFGSKDALLTAAMSEALAEWGAELAKAIAGAQVAMDASPAERMESTVGELVDTLAKHRELWVLMFDAYSRVELREQISAVCEHVKRGLAALLLGIPEDQVDEQSIRTIGALFFALVAGVVAQLLLDPHRAPNAADVISAIRMVFMDTRNAG